MKLIPGCLKDKSTIIIDANQHLDSDVSQNQSSKPLPLNKPISNRFSALKPIHKTPPLLQKLKYKKKIQHIQLSDDESLNSHEKSKIVPEIKKQKNPFKRRLIKASNKCKLEGRQFSSTQCCICLGSLENKEDSDIGKLPCKHAFCIDCIERSAKFCNKCPYCRTIFSQIENGLRFIEVKERNYEEFIDLDDEPCYVCGRNDDFDHLLECQFCQAAFCHTYCDTRLDSQAPPQDSWYCLSCSEIMQ